MEIDQMLLDEHIESTLRAIGFSAADVLARKGLEGFLRWLDASDWAAHDIAVELAKYPRTFGHPSLRTFSWIQLYACGEPSESRWAIEIPLTQSDGARSDMYMMLQVVYCAHGCRVSLEKSIVL